MFRICYREKNYVYQGRAIYPSKAVAEAIMADYQARFPNREYWIEKESE